MRGVTVGDVADLRQIHRIIDRRLVRMVYQPVIDLRDGHVVGFEALARGPADTPWSPAGVLFDAARRVGRLAELDWICIAHALRDARASGLPGTLTWLINSEPAAAGSPPPDDLRPVLDGSDDLRVIVEITERELAAAPGRLLDQVDQFRRRGWGIAVDDVGADTRSLALLPLLAPDVVKLDLSLTQHAGDPAVARVAHAVRAYAERTGTAVIAEGIETAGDRLSAPVLGATHAQGFSLHRPGPLPATVAAPDRPLPPPKPAAPATAGTPFELASAHRTPDHTTKARLVPMSRSLEAQALASGESTLVIGALQHVRHFSPATRRVHADIAASGGHIIDIAADMPDRPCPGVTGLALPPGSPLLGEWLLLVLGPHTTAGLAARELTAGDGGAPAASTPPAAPPASANQTAREPRLERDVAITEGERRFAYVLSYDRDLLVAAARAGLRQTAALS